MGGGWYKAGSGPAGKHLLHGAMRCCFQSRPGSSAHHLPPHTPHPRGCSCHTDPTLLELLYQHSLSTKGIYCKPAPLNQADPAAGKCCLQLPAAEESSMSSWAGNRDLQQQRGCGHTALPEIYWKHAFHCNMHLTRAHGIQPCNSHPWRLPVQRVLWPDISTCSLCTLDTNSSASCSHREPTLQQQPCQQQTNSWLAHIGVCDFDTDPWENWSGRREALATHPTDSKGKTSSCV